MGLVVQGSIYLLSQPADTKLLVSIVFTADDANSAAQLDQPCHVLAPTYIVGSTMSVVQSPVSGSASGSTASGSMSSTSIYVWTIISLKCTDCRQDMAPMKLHAVLYLTKHMQLQQTTTKTRDNKRVKPQVYGEVLTRDELMGHLENRREREGGEESSREGN